MGGKNDQEDTRNRVYHGGGHGRGGGSFELLPETLDSKLADAIRDLERLNAEHASKETIQSAQQILNSLTEQKKAELQKEGQINSARIQAKAQKSAADIEGNAQIKTAQLQKEAQISVAKIQQDPNEISQLEMEVFKIVKKYDVLKDTKAFETLANTTTDKEVKADMLTLEKDLKKLGMSLKVDGTIDEKTVNSLEALISKNAPAIKVYKEITGIDPIRNTPAVATDENVSKER